jgi:hypothetical protein
MLSEQFTNEERGVRGKGEKGRGLDRRGGVFFANLIPLPIKEVGGISLRWEAFPRG